MGAFTMPSLGADMDEGTLLEWLVRPGDSVRRGDLVAVVDTTKSAVEVEVFEDGVVTELLVAPGTTVSVGTPLAVIDASGAAAVQPGPPPPPVAARFVSPVVRHLAAAHGLTAGDLVGSGPGGAVTRADVEHAAAPPPVVLGSRRPVSPRARRLAADRGVDLADVRGTGRDGAVVGNDVIRVADARPADVTALPVGPSSREARAEAARQRAATMRMTIAALMARGKREIPHYYLQTTIDLAAAEAFLRDANEGRPPQDRLVPAALLLAAAARAARTVPEVNGTYTDDAFHPADHVHLGVAVALRGGGLVAPAIHDADTLRVDELMAGLRDLVARARSGRLRRPELTDATITVTNLGEQGADLVHGVITPPQVALVGFGRVVDRPVVVDGIVTARPCTVATLAGDHRVSDGHRGSRFLAAVDDLLQHPEAL